jgi:hypothetical protein
MNKSNLELYLKDRIQNQKIIQKCPKLKNIKNIEKYIKTIITKFIKDKYKKINKYTLRSNLAAINIFVSKNMPKDDMIKKIISAYLKCKNDFTILGDDIGDIDSARLFVTAQGYCHEVDELMTYLINSRDSDIEPLDQNRISRISDEQKTKLLKHNRVNWKLKKQYIQVLNNQSIHQLNNKTIFNTLELIGKLGYILVNDEPSNWKQGFKTSIEAIAYFLGYLDNLNKKDLNIVKKLRNRDGETIDQILSDKDRCSHLKGTNLICIYLYNFQKIKDKRLLPLFTYDKIKNEYYCPQFHNSKNFIQNVKNIQNEKCEFLCLSVSNNGKIIFTKRLSNQKLNDLQIEAIKNLTKEFDLI